MNFDVGAVADQPDRGRDTIDMIDVGGHRFNMVGVHCRWTVPAMHTGGGGMLLLNANPKVSLQGCSLTIRNPAAHRNINAFRVVTNPKSTLRSGAMPPDRTGGDNASVDPLVGNATAGAAIGSGSLAGANPPALPLVSIELDDTIIRGSATMVGLDVAADLQLRFDNGLLAIDGRLLHCSGAPLPTRPTSGSIRLSLNRVTSVTQSGVVQLEMTRQTPYPIRIDRVANSCVFVVPGGVAHFDIRNLPPDYFANDEGEDNDWLKINGMDNTYSSAAIDIDPLLVVADTQFRRRQYTMATWADGELKFADETASSWVIRWSGGPPPSLENDRLDEATPRDFMLDGSLASGFNFAELPTIPTTVGNELRRDEPATTPPDPTIDFGGEGSR